MNTMAKKGAPQRMKCSLRWSGEHTLIYRVPPSGEGSPLHGGNKKNWLRKGSAPTPAHYGKPWIFFVILTRL